MNCPTLYSDCLRVLVTSEGLFPALLDHVPIPARTHRDLVIQAATLVSEPQCPRQVQRSVVSLVSRWPDSQLRLGDLFPESQLNGVMSHGQPQSFLDMVLLGLLNVNAQSSLRTVDFTGISRSCIFELPVLYLPRSQRTCSDLVKTITDKCKMLVEDGDNLESVLSWKLRDLQENHFVSDYHGPDTLELHVDCKLNMSDWVAMIDEIVGICAQDLSPFRFKIRKLSVDNYDAKEQRQLKWFLASMDKRDLEQLFVYGKQRSLRLLLWELSDELSGLEKLLSFGLGCTGPRLVSDLVSPDDPDNASVTERVSDMLSHWTRLDVLQVVGMTAVSGRLSEWLTALHRPLKKISVYACKLTRSDLEALASSDHLPGLFHLGLEKNKLTGCGSALVNVVKNTPKLELLNLRETALTLDEKLTVVSYLRSSRRLETLALYEKEDMLPTSGYEELLQLACAVPRLRNFYVFPFNHRPFEVFRRPFVQESADRILVLNNRTDIQLYY